MNTKVVGYFALIIGVVLAVHMLAKTVVILHQTAELRWPDYVQMLLRLLAAMVGGLLAWRGWRRVRLAKAQEIVKDAARQALARQEQSRQENGPAGGENSPDVQRD